MLPKDDNKAITVLEPATINKCSFRMVSVGENPVEAKGMVGENQEVRRINVGIRRIPADYGKYVEVNNNVPNIEPPSATSFRDWQARGNQCFSIGRIPAPVPVPAPVPITRDVKNETKAELQFRKAVLNGAEEPFIESAHGVEYLNKEDGTYHSLMNFTIEPVGTVICTDWQETSEKFIDIKIICDGSQKILTINSKLYKQAAKIVLGEIPETYVESEVNNATKLIQKYLANKYKNNKNMLYHRQEVALCGWTKTVDNRMVYMHGGMDNCSSTKIIPPYHHERRREIFRAGFNAINIGNNLEAIVTPFIFGHLGFLCKLFEEASYPPRFCLLLKGVTNSYKTSLCLEILNVFETVPDKRMANLKYTFVALEMALAEARDSVFVLDDMALALKAEETDQNLKVERVLRIIGDDAVKSRASKNLKEQVKFKPRSVVCITAEDDLKSNLSSHLRLVTVDVNRNSYDPVKIDYFKQNKNIMREYYGAFIRFLEINFDEIATQIRALYPALRSQYKVAVNFPRLLDSLVTLVITSRLIIAFGLYCEAFDENYAAQLQAQFEKVLIETIQRSEESSKTRSPEEMYVIAINQLCATGGIHLAENVDIYKQEKSKYIGYKSKPSNELWFKHETLFEAVKSYWIKQDITLNTSSQKIHKLLYEKGITKGYLSEDGKRSYLKRSSLDGRPRMLCVDCEKFKQMLSQIN